MSDIPEELQDPENIICHEFDHGSAGARVIKALADYDYEIVRKMNRSLVEEAWGALNFILAFYDPGQNYLDTNAWKQAEASGRRVHAKLRKVLDEIKK